LALRFYEICSKVEFFLHFRFASARLASLDFLTTVGLDSICAQIFSLLVVWLPILAWALPISPFAALIFGRTWLGPILVAVASLCS
jgi:hypothetical protein